MTRLTEKWEKLELLVKDLFERVDPPARQPTRSGGSKRTEDVISRRYMASCKYRSRKNIVIKQEDWERLCKEAELLDRIPIMVSENVSHEVIVSMRLSDYVEVIQ
jgi:hypothetical protein